MSLAHGYLAQSMQSHDEREAARINERRLAVADRFALEAEAVARAGSQGRSGARAIAGGPTGGRLHRLAERLHLVGGRGTQHRGARAAH